MDRPGSNVKAIFIAALDHEPGADRSDYLAAACGDNADLRRRVEALLAAHERADAVLGPAGEPSSEPVTSDSNAGRPIDEATSGESPEHEVSSSEASITDAYRSTAEPDVLIAGRYTLQQKLVKGVWGKSGSPSNPSPSNAKSRSS